MTIIETVNNQKFIFNGIEYYKNFMPKVVGDKIEIINVYDSKIRLTDFPTLYSDIKVDGIVYASVNTTQIALLPVLYTRGSLTGGDSLFLGNFISLAALQAAYPTAPSGSRANIIVSGGQDDLAVWDSGDSEWVVFLGQGGGSVISVNGYVDAVVLDADDIDDSTTLHKFASEAQLDQIATNQADIAELQAKKPVANTYLNPTALFADQANQEEGYFYSITDATGYGNITNGRATVSYKGTTNGDETDYNIEWKDDLSNVQNVNTYENVSELIADQSNQTQGNIYKTKGYLNALDGGGNSYILVDNGSLVVDHGSIIDAGGTLRYVAVNPENLNNKHFGIFSDSSTNWVVTASSRFNGMLRYSVNHQLIITSEIGTYFNCQLNLNSTHSGSRIHFDNAVFSDLIHFVGEVSPLAYLTDVHLTGTITTYDRFGSSYCKNVTGKLNIICKEDTSIQPDGTGGRGVHIYASTENHNYGTIIVEQNESQSTSPNNQAAVGIDGVTISATAIYPKNINIDFIWVKDCRTHGVLLTGEGHNIRSIRVDNYGDELFDTGLPSVVGTDYLGNNTQQVCCGVFTYFTNAKIGEMTVNQSSFTGRKRSLIDVYIGRGLYNGATYEFSGVKIDRIISKNPQRQAVSVCNYQREGTASIGDIHINEISDNNLMQLNAAGERTDYGLVDIGFAAVDIKRIIAPNYKDAILLLQRDNSYNGTQKQATAVTVGQIIKRLVSTNGTAYDIFQGSIGYILAWGDANNKGSYSI